MLYIKLVAGAITPPSLAEDAAFTSVTLRAGSPLDSSRALASADLAPSADIRASTVRYAFVPHAAGPCATPQQDGARTLKRVSAPDGHLKITCMMPGNADDELKLTVIL